MAQKRILTKKVLLIPVLIAVFGAGVLLFTIGGFAYAAYQESHDSFCTSCHTQPESTFYQRSTGQAPVDLASFHQPHEGRCIDCHSGPGMVGRISAELMGAGNAFKWYTGTAVQPAVLTSPIDDANCLKCHHDVIQRGYKPKEQITVPGARGEEGEEGEEEGGMGHWHRELARWQAKSVDAATCVSCHPGHQAGESAQAGFMNSTAVRRECQGCHQVMRREGEGGGSEGETESD